MRSVVILVHGIRTNAPWVAMLRAQFEKVGIVVQPTNYGRLDALKFLWGSRRKPLEAVWNSVRDIKKLYPNAEISFLAHSFGTYIVSQMLRREFDLKAHRIVFCGSVVNYQFPFYDISERFQQPIINETSARDPWPVLAEGLTWGYGSAGTFGFKKPRVRDRWHRGYGHSQYLTEEFCTKFWIPYFQNGLIVEGDIVDDTPPLWLRIFSVLNVKYAALLFAGLIVAAYVGPPSWRTEVKNYIGIGMHPKPPYPPDPGVIATGPPIIGTQPNPNCSLETVTDTTVNPPKSFKAWKCPSPVDQEMPTPTIGPQPNPDCYVVAKSDVTTNPPKFFKVWKCP